MNVTSRREVRGRCEEYSLSNSEGVTTNRVWIGPISEWNHSKRALHKIILLALNHCLHTQVYWKISLALANEHNIL